MKYSFTTTLENPGKVQESSQTNKQKQQVKLLRLLCNDEHLSERQLLNTSLLAS